jgi:hypothetical protein
MAIQEDLTNAIEQGRDEVVGVLADHRVLPVVVDDPERRSSNLLGQSSALRISLERQEGEESEHAADRQTRQRVVDTLGITSEAECEDVRAEIRSHESW